MRVFQMFLNIFRTCSLWKGKATDPKTTETIKNWQQPKTVMDMCSFFTFHKFTKYIQQLEKRLQWAYQNAQEYNKCEQLEINKIMTDVWIVPSSMLEIKCCYEKQLIMENTRFPIGGENQVYIVISKPFDNLPVFRTKP